ncbi:MAG: bacterial Ig-like domain-containing protein [Firmicutes bacterium]|nr:bacterial Ig-like domain-containing protein [Bacillota bacterium]
MKKKFVLSVAFIIAVMLFAAGCVSRSDGGGEPRQLPAPTNLAVSGQTLSWSPVRNAVGYEVSIDGVVKSASTNTYSLSNLTAAKTYALKVRALGNNRSYTDSDWSDAFPYTVTGPGDGQNPGNVTVQSFIIKTVPNKRNYTVGETFSDAGMVLTVTYSDNSVEDVTTGWATSILRGTPLMLMHSGNVIVMYKGLTQTFPITVTPATQPTPTVVSIAVKTPPKTSYYAGESADFAGMVLAVVYSNGTAVDVTTGWTADKNGTLTADDREVVITYQGVTVILPITVAAVRSLSIVTYPKREFIENEVFATTGMVLEADYGGAVTSRTVNSGYTVSRVSGTLYRADDGIIITVTYQGATVQYAISVKWVIDIVLSGSRFDLYDCGYKTDYGVGELFDKMNDGLVVTVIFNRGEQATVTNYSVSPNTPLTKLDTLITIDYFGVSKPYPITVASFLTNVEISNAYLTLVKGLAGHETAALSAMLVPADADNVVGVSWASLNPAVASVSADGLVMAGGAGETTITMTVVTTADTIVKTCAVKVNDAANPTLIGSRAEFEAMLGGSRNGYYVLTNDIDFAGAPLRPPAWAYAEWYPESRILNGSDEENAWYTDHRTFFNGIFDGRGYALKNLTVVHPSEGAPDVGGLEPATWGTSIFGVIGKSGAVQNVSIVNYTASGLGQSTVIAQHNHGIVRNCRFESITLVGDNPYGDFRNSNAVIVAFNYNVVNACVITGVNFWFSSNPFTAVHAFVVSNRTNGVTYGDVTNCFVLNPGEGAISWSPYPEGIFGWLWIDFVVPTWAGCKTVLSGSVSGESWIGLDPAVWDFAAGGIPTLKIM